MISNVFKVLTHAYNFFMHHSIFDSYFSLFDMRPLFAILKTAFIFFTLCNINLLAIFNFGSMIFVIFFKYINKYGIKMK